MAKIREDQRKALEALGYKVGKSGMTVQNAKGETLGGFNENNQIFSGNSKVRDILKSKPPAAAPAAPARRAAAPSRPAAPKPKGKPAINVSGAKAEARRSGPPIPRTAPSTPAARPGFRWPRPGVNRSGAPGTIRRGSR